MCFNVIDIIDKDLNDTELKEIINKKIYNIINIIEFNYY